jgi:hypothetical protein
MQEEWRYLIQPLFPHMRAKGGETLSHGFKFLYESAEWRKLYPQTVNVIQPEVE